MVQKTPAPHCQPPAIRSGLLPVVLVSAWLWLRLLNHLRVEWTVNEQYAYGWAVPFLCLFLAYRRWREFPSPPRPGKDSTGGLSRLAPLNPSATSPTLRAPSPPLRAEERDGERRRSSSPDPKLRFSFSVFRFFSFFLLTAFLFTRWIEEANPDWRLMSWALALEVIAFTLVAVSALGGAGRLRQLAFPILFFLVAVPWPTPVEQPVIQALTRALVAVTVEVLNAFGVAALPHGNVIETAGGLVDIDEACSGIRSLQAVLMLALFFGELRRFNAARRAGLCLIAFALAFVFNLARTVTLSLIAARHGPEAVHAWHDPAGIAILVGCFLGVWAVAAWLGRGQGEDTETQKNLPSPPRPGRGIEGEVSNSGSSLFPVFRFRNFCFPPSPLSPRLTVALFALLLAGEGAVQLWYASAPPSAAAGWRVELPEANSSFQQAGLPKAAVKILRFNEAQSGTWQNPDGTRWQMIYLRWNPGRTAVYLARNHTPEICLPAAGRNLRGISEISHVQAGGFDLPFRCYTTGPESQPLHVFYSLWEDGVREQRVTTQLLTRPARWSAVLERRRNPGQRVLQIAIWGARDAAHAEELLRSELPKLIQQNAETLKR